MTAIAPGGSRIFVLSPANCSGPRARLVLAPQSRFDLAVRLREPEGAALGDIFSFVSGLYFRGKLAYARAFAKPPPGVPGVLVITPNLGLLASGERVTRPILRSFGRTSIDETQARYRLPLLRDARRIAFEAGGCPVVLLGSIATAKYIQVLGEAFGDRLVFPRAFIGRGDMSRGGLMLRSVDSGVELEYVPVEGASRRGPRPPRLDRRV